MLIERRAWLQAQRCQSIYTVMYESIYNDYQTNIYAILRGALKVPRSQAVLGAVHPAEVISDMTPTTRCKAGRIWEQKKFTQASLGRVAACLGADLVARLSDRPRRPVS